jgi:hypothetical protein
LPDLGLLGSGLLQDVAGESSIFLPRRVMFDIFVVNFLDLNPSLSIKDVCFTVFASSNDFLVGVDPATGIRTTYGSSVILPLTRCVPDSGSAMFDFGVLSIIALGAMFQGMQPYGGRKV